MNYTRHRYDDQIVTLNCLSEVFEHKNCLEKGKEENYILL